jgi:hypothetical protein
MAKHDDSDLRPIEQREAAAMWRALKDIAAYYNPAAPESGAQGAARRARATLEELDLLYVEDAKQKPM